MGLILRWFYAVGFSVLLVFDTAGQLGFKLAATSAGPARFDPVWLTQIAASGWIYVAVGAYVGAFFTWMTLLEHAPIGPAFAASHGEVVTVLVLSVVLLGESLSATQMVGSVLIVAGIGVLAYAEGDARAEAESS